MLQVGATGIYVYTQLENMILLSFVLLYNDVVAAGLQIMGTTLG
jgi:hypothetical protein